MRLHASRSDASDRSRLARSRSSRLTTTSRGSDEVVGRRPHLFGLHHHARDGVDDDERGVGDVQRGARVAQEVADAGRVDEIDLLFVPLGVREARRERVLARDLFLVVVGDGRSLVDLAEPVDGAGVEEHGGGELGLSGSAVTDESDVSDGCGVVDLHTRTTPWLHPHHIDPVRGAARPAHVRRHEATKVHEAHETQFVHAEIRGLRVSSCLRDEAVAAIRNGGRRSGRGATP